MKTLLLPTKPSLEQNNQVSKKLKINQKNKPNK